MSGITILGKHWDIIYFDDNDLITNMGACDQGNLRISVNKNLARDQIGETILHEMLHAVDLELGLGLRESQVRQLSTGLYSAGVQIVIPDGAMV